MQNNLINICDLLRLINAFVGLLMVLCYALFKESIYLNQITFLEGIVLVIQLHLSLSRRHQSLDPFVIVLAYYITVYYSLRVITLAVFNYSDVLHRFPYGPEDTNYALSFIISCNASMLFGFSLMREVASLPFRRSDSSHEVEDVYLPVHPILFLLTLSVMASVLGIFDWAAGQSRALGVLIFFVRPSAAFLLIGAFCVECYRQIPMRYIKWYIVLYLIFSMHLILGGVRGLIVYTIEMFLLIIVVSEKFFIRKQILLRSIMLTPLLVAVLLITYNFATLQRSSSIIRENTRLEIVLDNLYDAVTNGDGVNDFTGNLAHVFARVGYLDFSAEVIAHKQQYISIFNASNYIKSFVDNLLTPGFDFYDTPKIAHSLIFKHQNLHDRIPSKSFLMDNKIYHSDQLGLFGEFYALFGWYSLIVLFAFAYTIKWAYYNIYVTGNRYEELAKRLLILYFYINLINSFGIDWIIIQAIPVCFATYVLIFYFRKSSQNNLTKIEI